MRSRPRAASLLVTCLVASVAAACAEPVAPSPLTTLRRPRSVLLVSLDSVRADRLGAYGYARHPTSPFLDAFAAQEILFERAIVQVPRSAPSHMSLMTGLHPHHHGVVDGARLAPGVATLASLLKERGYVTQGFAGGGALQAEQGFARGFDGYEDQRVGGKEVFARAKRWLRASGGEPFFLFLQTDEVAARGAGPCYTSPERHAGRFSRGIDTALRADSPEDFERLWSARRDQLTDGDRDYVRATYAEGVQRADALVADLFDFLERRGMLADLLVVVWSDRGVGLFDHGSWSSDELYDHTLRVPLLMKLPGWEAGGRRVRSVVSAIDVLPTILQLVGGPVPPRLDGASLLALLEAEDPARVAFSARTEDGARAFSLRTRDAHFVWDDVERRGSWFDLRADPAEQHDRFGQDPAAEAAKSRLDAWMEAWAAARAGGAAGTGPADADALDDLRALGYVDD